MITRIWFPACVESNFYSLENPFASYFDIYPKSSYRGTQHMEETSLLGGGSYVFLNSICHWKNLSQWLHGRYLPPVWETLRPAGYPYLQKHLTSWLHGWYRSVGGRKSYEKRLFWWKNLPQWLQEWFLSPVWEVICLARYPYQPEHLTQWLHGRYFSPVWVDICQNSWSPRLKHLPH